MSILPVRFISASVGACRYVVAFTNKMPCEICVSELVRLLSPLLEKNVMCLKAPVVWPSCLRFAFA